MDDRTAQLRALLSGLGSALFLFGGRPGGVVVHGDDATGLAQDCELLRKDWVATMDAAGADRSLSAPGATSWFGDSSDRHREAETAQADG